MWVINVLEKWKIIIIIDNKIYIISHKCIHTFGVEIRKY